MKCMLISLLTMAGAFLANTAGAGTPEASPSSSTLKTVVHLNYGDPERQGKALGNIENILKEDSKAVIEVVCHGDGIALVHKKESKHPEQVAELMKQGVRFAGCENTMKKKSIQTEELLAGVSTVPSGAVEVIRKQQEGYSYFRP